MRSDVLIQSRSPEQLKLRRKSSQFNGKPCALSVLGLTVKTIYYDVICKKLQQLPTKLPNEF